MRTKALAKNDKAKKSLEDIENFNWHPRAGEYDRYMQFQAESKAIESREPFKPAKVAYSITCQFCKKSGFHWYNSYGKWILIDDEGIKHQCRQTVSIDPDDDIPF